eukprot:TRINITY_DN12854_c0_g1_i1.p1 TRINITY_DN12854_c0_g1~~TRINITY_DN12854_c0_g1_i1.p1  ORF type:complete len:1121 (+),score=328.85 TRINITY_DN12854_c0_g1_i1:409-3771(+)
MSTPSFFRQVVDHCKDILTVAKQFKQLVERGGDFDLAEVTEIARRAATTTQQLIRTVDRNIANDSNNDTPDVTRKKTKLRQSSRDVAANVLNLVDATKAVGSNPYDFLTKQKHGDKAEQTVASVQTVLNCIEALQASTQTNEPKNNINPLARQAVMDVKKLCAAVKSSTAEDFVTAAKKCATSLTTLVDAAKRSGFAQEEAALRGLTHKFVFAAREVFRAPKDEKKVAELDVKKREVAETIQKIMVLASQFQPTKKSPPQESSPFPTSASSASVLQSPVRSSSPSKRAFTRDARDAASSASTPSVLSVKAAFKSGGAPRHHRSSSGSSSPSRGSIGKQQRSCSSLAVKALLDSRTNFESTPAQDVAQCAEKAAGNIIALMSRDFKSFNEEWSKKSKSMQAVYVSVLSEVVSDAMKSSMISASRGMPQSPSFGSLTSAMSSGASFSRDDTRELDKIVNMNSFADWRRSIRIGTIGKRFQMPPIFGNPEEKNNDLGEQTQLIMDQLSETIDNVIITSNAYATFDMIGGAGMSDSQSGKVELDILTKQACQVAKAGLSFSTSRFPPSQIAVETILDGTIAFLDATTKSLNNLDDLIDQKCVNAAAGPLKGLIVRNLRTRLYDASDLLRAVTVHMLATMRAMAHLDEMNHNDVITLSVTAREFVRALRRLLVIAVTSKTITTGVNNSLHSTTGARDASEISADEQMVEVNIWKEKTDHRKCVYSWEEPVREKVKVKTASLNRLVEYLTPPSITDMRYANTFMTTYRSFCTPYALFGKLVERYQVPAKTLPLDKARAVQECVCSVITSWLSSQFEDFDTRLLERVADFVRTTVPQDGHDIVAKRMASLLDEKFKERQSIDQTMFSAPPTDMTLPEHNMTPAHLFNSLTNEEIARQLTLIDHRIYSKIAPAELMHLSWTKDAQHQSPNVRALLERLNHLSFWIPTAILVQEKVKDRALMIEKLITIMKHLREMNNYCTLMGFVAGLNISSVRRLKHTHAMVDTKLIALFESFEKLMAPASSFKAFRAAFGKSKLPAIPYLGVFLTDLTFIEEGNPDRIDGKINFKKSKLTYKVIQQQEEYQKHGYKFIKLEPISTILLEMPHCDEKELHEISLMREPRNARKEDIV